MSCHNVGEALNSVVKVVIKLYDEGEVPLDSARKIIRACGLGVHWCDGNEYEAWDCIYDYRCGLCLRVVEKGSLLFNTNDFWRLSYKKDNRELPDCNKIHRDNGLASDKLCKDCFIQVVNNYYRRDDAGEEMIDYFIANLEEDEYTSNGEYVN